MITYISSIWRYVKIVLVIVLVSSLVHVWGMYQREKDDRVRLQENVENNIKKDSVGFLKQNLTTSEVTEKIYYTDPYLSKILKENNIEIKQLRRVITTQNEFFAKDTTKYILNEILDGVRNNKVASQKIVSSDSCYLVSANLNFDGKDITMTLDEVRFLTRSDVIAHAEKVGLRFWKWFRKKKITVTVVDKCGNSTTELINIEK